MVTVSSVVDEEVASPDANVSIADAFTALGDETRLAILQTLWDEGVSRSRSHPVSFSTLFDRVGCADTGNFSYHLGKLTDHYVCRNGDGYELTEAGRCVVRFVRYGSVTGPDSSGAVKIDEACPNCDAPIELDATKQRTVVRCTESAVLRDDGANPCRFRLTLPPANWTNRTPSAAFRAAVGTELGRVRSFLEGGCPHCGGPVEEFFEGGGAWSDGDTWFGGATDRSNAVEIRERCQRCSSTVRVPLAIGVLAHPSIVAFFHEHGHRLRFASWETVRRGRTVDTTVLEVEPLRARVTVSGFGAERRLLVGENRRVVDAASESTVPVR